MSTITNTLAALGFMGAAAVLPGHPSPAEVRQAYAQASIQACRTQVCTRPREGCMEDMPCWDWARMGDRQRGVVIKAGRSRDGLVTTVAKPVGVCEFQALVRARLIYWRETPRLRGDRTAMRAVCFPGGVR